MKKPNHLIHETSPYLLQHAYNPVDWYPWGDEALQKAKAEDKPILVSIGYSACHWCHVMERESFEDADVAALMNEYFVNIKIDREERPDLDHIYMEALQAISGSGGWPLNVFLTPDAKPFYGGTYFPPQPAYGRASWPQVLITINDAWKNQKEQLKEQAQNLIEHIEKPLFFDVKAAYKELVGSRNLLTKAQIEIVAQNSLKTADKFWGGFGSAPKFPQTFMLSFLLQHYYFFGNKKALDQVILSLDKMAMGGIYDHVGGGFCRYSTDAQWLVPHFEKMLYDNALLISVYSDAFRLTGTEMYRQTVYDTIEFLDREMKHSSGGYFAALDADSEGVEGKFYVWSKTEFAEVVGEHASLLASFFDVTEKGNWEGTNILWMKKSLQDVAAENNISVNSLMEIIDEGKKALLEKRNGRVRPLTDDKIILSWNSLLLTALCKAFQAFDDTALLTKAIELHGFIKQNFYQSNTQEMYHIVHHGQQKFAAVLEDYANYIFALITLQQTTGDNSYLSEAKDLMNWVIPQFKDAKLPQFYFTKVDQADVVVRKAEWYDGAMPSSNAMMAYCLHYLSIIFDDKHWRLMALELCAGMKNSVEKYPGSFALWASLMQEMEVGTAEVAISGKKRLEIFRKISQSIFSGILLQTGAPDEVFPLLKGRTEEDEDGIYVCHANVCEAPVKLVADAINLIKKRQLANFSQ